MPVIVALLMVTASVPLLYVIYTAFISPLPLIVALFTVIASKPLFNELYVDLSSPLPLMVALLTVMLSVGEDRIDPKPCVIAELVTLSLKKYGYNRLAYRV